MSVAIDGFDKECTKCDNASMFGKEVYKRKWVILSEYSYTEYKCSVCGHFEGRPLDVKRNDILKELGI